MVVSLYILSVIQPPYGRKAPSNTTRRKRERPRGACGCPTYPYRQALQAGVGGPDGRGRPTEYGRRPPHLTVVRRFPPFIATRPIGGLYHGSTWGGHPSRLLASGGRRDAGPHTGHSRALGVGGGGSCGGLSGFVYFDLLRRTRPRDARCEKVYHYEPHKSRNGAGHCF